jgi:hypothetical protein
MEKRPHKPPRYKVRRPNPSVIRNQVPKTPAMLIPYWLSAKLYAVFGGKPACSRKYEEYPEKEFLLKFCFELPSTYTRFLCVEDRYL